MSDAFPRINFLAPERVKWMWWNVKYKGQKDGDLLLVVGLLTWFKFLLKVFLVCIYLSCMCQSGKMQETSFTLCRSSSGFSLYIAHVFLAKNLSFHFGFIHEFEILKWSLTKCLKFLTFIKILNGCVSNQQYFLSGFLGSVPNSSKCLQTSKLLTMSGWFNTVSNRVLLKNSQLSWLCTYCCLCTDIYFHCRLELMGVWRGFSVPPAKCALWVPVLCLIYVATVYHMRQIGCAGEPVWISSRVKCYDSFWKRGDGHFVDPTNCQTMVYITTWCYK